jgi:hypothetical protein
METSVQNHTPAVLVVIRTKKIITIEPDSYAARFACGEIIPLDQHSREPDAEVLCADRLMKKMGGDVLTSN